MPGKVNPVIPEVVTQVAAQVIGNDDGDRDRRHAGPLRAERLRAADGAEPAAVDQAARRRRAACSTRSASPGIEANREQCERYAELTLSAATALNPYIGYDKATEIVKKAVGLRPVAARGRAGGGRLRRRARRGARLPQDGAPARLGRNDEGPPEGGPSYSVVRVGLVAVQLQHPDRPAVSRRVEHAVLRVERQARDRDRRQSGGGRPPHPGPANRHEDAEVRADVEPVRLRVKR